MTRIRPVLLLAAATACAAPESEAPVVTFASDLMRYHPPEIEDCMRHTHFELCFGRLAEHAVCDASGPPVPIVRFDPRYVSPEGADPAGWVDVEARVSSAGVPTDIRVVAAEPEGLFEVEAARAMRRWRYCPDVHHGKRLAERIELLPLR